MKKQMRRVVPLVMASIINKGIASSDTHYIIRMSGVLLLLAVVGLVFSLTAQYFSANVAVYAAAEIRRDLFGFSALFFRAARSNR